MCSHWGNKIYIYFKKESSAKNTNIAHSSCATNLEHIVFTIFRKLRETDKSMSYLVWKAQKVVVVFYFSEPTSHKHTLTINIFAWSTSFVHNGSIVFLFNGFRSPSFLYCLNIWAVGSWKPSATHVSLVKAEVTDYMCMPSVVGTNSKSEANTKQQCISVIYNSFTFDKITTFWWNKQLKLWKSCI